ncbi:hypothetical protein C8Q75DRAFT_500298 [Abortiporus biennis]|nr:hypothetical protein C8Q75DRAFT_500298 [Abortiporus biennis]
MPFPWSVDYLHLSQPRLFRIIDIEIQCILSLESYTQISTRLHFLLSSRMCCAIQHLSILMSGMQMSIEPSSLSSKLLNDILTSLPRLPNLYRLYLRRISINSSVLRSIALSSVTSLILHGCPADVTFSEMQEEKDPVQFKLTHLTFVPRMIDDSRLYADPWWILLIDPCIIQFLDIREPYFRSTAFITKLARSSTIPPLRHLHTLKLDASHLPLLELGLALSKLPALVELTENDSRVRVLNSSQALQDFENSLSKEALPNLRKIRVHYQIAPSLCRNRKLQSVIISGQIKEYHDLIMLYESLRDGSSSSLSSLEVFTKAPVTIGYLSDILTTFFNLQSLKISTETGLQCTIDEAEKMLHGMALPTTLCHIEVRSPTLPRQYQYLKQTLFMYLSSSCPHLAKLKIACLDGTFAFP